MDMELGGRTAMGAVAVTDAPELTVRLLATDLPAGASLEAVIGTVDLAGVSDLTPATRTIRVSARQLARADTGRQGDARRRSVRPYPGPER